MLMFVENYLLITMGPSKEIISIHFFMHLLNAHQGTNSKTRHLFSDICSIKEF